MYAYMPPCDFDNIFEWFSTKFEVVIDGVVKKWDLHIGYNSHILSKHKINIDDYVKLVFRQVEKDTQLDIDSNSDFRVLPKHIKIENLYNKINEIDIDFYDLKYEGLT